MGHKTGGKKGCIILCGYVNINNLIATLDDTNSYIIGSKVIVLIFHSFSFTFFILTAKTT